MAKTTKKKNKISVFDVVNLIAMILVGLIMLMPILNLAAKAFSSEGKFPRHFLLSEREDKIYCANQLSSELTVFDLNAEGVPRLKCAVPMPGAAMVLSV